MNSADHNTTVAHDARELRGMVKDVADHATVDGVLLEIYRVDATPVIIHFDSRVLYELFSMGIAGREYQQGELTVSVKQQE